MTRLWLRIISFLIIIVEIIAFILTIFGLFIRFSGVGNPVGSIYLFVGGFLALGGGIAISFVSRQRRPVPKEETTASERYTEKQDGGISHDQETENPHSFL